jgi:hypothetical protein
MAGAGNRPAREPAARMLGPVRPPISTTSRALRIRQGVILIIGAIVIALAIGGSHSGFYWTPLSLGLIYLVGAAAGGPRGSYWATAVVLVGWGTAVVIVRQFSPDLDTAGLYLLGAGVGATVGMVLAGHGFAVSPIGMALTVAVGGLVLSVEPRDSALLGDARFYALLIGVVGAVNLLMATVDDNDGARATRRPQPSGE